MYLRQRSGRPRDHSRYGAGLVAVALALAATGPAAASPAASAMAAAGITLGGQSVQADGTLPAPTQTAVTVGGSTLDVTVNAGSAAILTLTP